MEPARYRVRVLNDSGAPWSYALPPGTTWIGRAADVADPGSGQSRPTIHLPHPDVERLHAVLTVDAAGVLLEDREHKSGTFVAGRRLPFGEPYRLQEGESWRIGPFVLVLVVARDPQPPAFPATLDPAERWPYPAPEAYLPPERMPPDEAPDEAPVSRYLADLPALYQSDEAFLGRYLKIFEAIWEPLEQRQDQIALYFDPRTCPASFLPWLAGWLQLPVEPDLPVERLRDLVFEAYWLLRWRGTHYGLTRLIELATGCTPAIGVAPEEPFVIDVRMPRPADPRISEDLIERLLLRHKPAHCAYRLELIP